MPYGIKDETKEQTEWMDSCVGSVTGTNPRTDKPYKKGEKVAICKVQLNKTGISEAVAGTTIRDLENKFANQLREDQPNVDVYIEDIDLSGFVVAYSDGVYYKIPYEFKGDSIVYDWNMAREVTRRTVWESVSSVADIEKVREGLAQRGR